MATGTIETDTTIDLSGLKCPLPVLRVKKALASIDEGKTLLVLTTDPASVDDIPAFLRMAGYALLHVEETQTGHRFVVRK